MRPAWQPCQAPCATRRARVRDRRNLAVGGARTSDVLERRTQARRTQAAPAERADIAPVVIGVNDTLWRTVGIRPRPFAAAGLRRSPRP